VQVLPERTGDHVFHGLPACRCYLSRTGRELCVYFHLGRCHGWDATSGVETPGRGMRHDGMVPNQPKTPQRSFRIPDDIFLPAKAKAQEEGVSLSEVVRDALIEYVGDDEDDG
jgi:hypothetical protein